MSSHKTGYVWHDQFAWHDTGTGAGFLEAGGYVQPHQHIESPESKRRMAELVAVSGMADQLVSLRASMASESTLQLFHTVEYIKRIKNLSAAHGGDAGGMSPFGRGSYEIACLSVGGCINLAEAIWLGDVKNGYALTRPPGHHAHADAGDGFCIFANGVLAIKHLQKKYPVKRVAVIDWDVHHGNSVQEAFWRDPSVLAISLHQDNAFPENSGSVDEIGAGLGRGTCLNIPLPAGSGHGAYMEAFARVVLPALRRYQPELIIVHSGFDASNMDPLGRMMLHSDSYREMTRALMKVADEFSGGKLAIFHEGGYSPVYVPYCGLAVLEELSGHRTEVIDPYLEMWKNHPGQDVLPHQVDCISRTQALIELVPTP